MNNFINGLANSAN